MSHDRALTEWRAILGADAVVTHDDDVRRHNTATYATPAQLAAVLYPDSTAQVSEAMRIATRHGVAVYPWSRGRNWGYGSRTPVVDGSVGIDLGRMNRILDIDDEMGTATIEPGVSFWELVHALHERGNRWFVSVPGTSADASVVGNLLERGWGFGPYSDRFAHSAGMEVVLADGTVIRTGRAAVLTWGANGFHRGANSGGRSPSTASRTAAAMSASRSAGGSPAKSGSVTVKWSSTRPSAKVWMSAARISSRWLVSPPVTR